MQRAAILATLCLAPALACAEADCPATAAPADAPPPADAASASAAASTTARGGGATLHANVQKTASSAAKLDRVKLRFDGSGAFVKQSVYHGDAELIPAAVRELAERTYPGATPQYYETEVYADLGEIYEVELETAEGQRCELAASPEGALAYSECRVDPAELPAAVSAAVSAAAPGAELLEAEHKTTEGGEEEYSIEVKHEGRELYLHIAPDGELKSKHLRVPAVVELPLD